MIKGVNKVDEGLMRGLLAADSQSVGKIYDLALPSVIKWIEENNGTESDARDVFQDGLIALYKKIQNGDFELTCTLKSFLRIICRNLWLTKLRDNKKEATRLEDIDEVVIDEEVTTYLESAERRALYLKHYENLGEQCRNILQWFFDKVPLKEIAKRIDTSEGYIKKKKFLCKEKLVQNIQNDNLYGELKSNI